MTRPGGKGTETRAAILAVAERLLVDGGVAGVSLDRVAEAAGITRGAIRRHFRSKNELLLAMAANRYVARTEVDEGENSA